MSSVLDDNFIMYSTNYFLKGSSSYFSVAKPPVGDSFEDYDGERNCVRHGETRRPKRSRLCIT